MVTFLRPHCLICGASDLRIQIGIAEKGVPHNAL